MRSSSPLMAALLLLLLVSLAAADIHIPDREKSQEEMRLIFMQWKAKAGSTNSSIGEEEMRLIFMEWKAKIGRTYSSIGEEERHYAAFKDELRNIAQQNATEIHRSHRGCVIIPSDHDERKAAWILIAYMLFGCGFIIYLWLFVLQRNPLD
ncbi:unnamed protein product [Alopecurus aequalis]